MKNPSHDGERAVQCRAKEGREGWGSPMFDATIPGAFAKFLLDQHMLIIGASDDRGAMWSTVLSGRPGFVNATDERTIVIDTVPGQGDPLQSTFESAQDIGILALQPQTQRRIRANGVATRSGHQLVVRTEQVLGNCPKYLQLRSVSHVDETATRGTAQSAAELTDDQTRWITQSDTFFIASRSPEHGADSSSRGGMPGFVTVVGTRRLRWPDYAGNQFYMTLGNMHLNPAIGLLFIDWESGHTLQLTGTGRIDWNPGSAKVHPGALRVIEFDIDEIVQINNASSLRWQLHEYSRHNPPSK
ncbi:pyridoxamine 5'-phosphate oxidase family protein [Kribbella sp. CA-293567]|uniref:pyridoxamine 5'-phosphate oxidase family protein n=1 Tax=Kribbella sp. CA-293567 TaxID=3002436 RepID=UPI0022DE2A06|nr:pyridoxamine 5'-phosphate oxidase family protein [Kribbella sp. CA-293567]WBQ04399.1 pyridoxamine 5'-phosphate oxidase family protein [Kribbella sp. CA-293567]